MHISKRLFILAKYTKYTNKKMNQYPESKKQDMLIALETCKGIISDACKAIGIERKTHYNWYNSDETYKQAVDDINEGAIDYVESKLFERIEGVQIAKYDMEGQLVPYTLPPDTTAIIFYLKTKGKKRGYVEKTEIDNNHNLNKDTFEIFGKIIDF